MVDLQDEILTKTDEKFNDSKTAIIAEIRDQIKQEVSVALEKEIKKREELESTACMLQEHVKNYQEQVNELKEDELEQYGRWLCVRIDGVPVAENETSNDLKCNGVKCKSIVRFMTFRHRTMFYHSRKNLKPNVKVKLDLTKKHLIFTEGMQLVRNNEDVKFVMADINCCLKVVFKDGNSLFFSDCDNLRDILNKKRIDCRSKMFFRMNVLGDFAVCGGVGVPVLVSLFDKVACLKACKFIVGRFRCRCFPVCITKIADGCF